MKINNIAELEQLLLNDDITPTQAKKVLIKSLSLLDVSFGDEVITKEQILKEIEVLKVCLENNEIPLFSLSQIQDGKINEYNIKNIFKNGISAR